MPLLRNMTDAQVIERISGLVRYVSNWVDGELVLNGFDGAYKIDIEVKVQGKKNVEHLRMLGGVLQEISLMIDRREGFQPSEEEL